jgi:hypothetical protein
LYSELAVRKHAFIGMYPDILENEYMMKIEDFSRELFLDPSECENAFYILPKLTRDSFSKKGVFTRTEKIIIQNYS